MDGQEIEILTQKKNKHKEVKKNRRRNPESTRELLLETAGKLLARDGPEGLSVSQVVKEAGVNRGTAYHHFQTREQLLNETMDWVSNRLCEVAFDDELLSDWSSGQNPRFVIEKVINFVLEYPEFGPAWLYRSVIQGDYEQDPFWKKFSEHMALFSKSTFAEPDIDIEVYSFMILSSLFLWPHWVQSTSQSKKKRSYYS